MALLYLMLGLVLMCGFVSAAPQRDDGDDGYGNETDMESEMADFYRKFEASLQRDDGDDGYEDETDIESEMADIFGGILTSPQRDDGDDGYENKTAMESEMADFFRKFEASLQGEDGDDGYGNETDMESEMADFYRKFEASLQRDDGDDGYEDETDIESEMADIFGGILTYRKRDDDDDGCDDETDADSKMEDIFIKFPPSDPKEKDGREKKVQTIPEKLLPGLKNVLLRDDGDDDCEEETDADSEMTDILSGFQPSDPKEKDGREKKVQTIPKEWLPDLKNFKLKPVQPSKSPNEKTTSKTLPRL